MTRIVVLGTGTEIGKTHASVAIASALSDMGFSVAALKPVESGVPIHEPTATTDAAALAAVSSVRSTSPPPYAFADPVSPHLAARRANVSIDLGRITNWVDTHSAHVVLVETAGAMLSPLGRTVTNLDLSRALKPDHLLLVAPDRLGVLHDVMTTLYALRMLAPEMPRPAILLQPPKEPDASTGTNADEIVWLRIASKAHVFPRAPSTDAMTIAAARSIIDEWLVA